jgi:hypothetical protein
MTQLMQHIRRNALPYLACVVVLALGVGGGYAYAASKTKTIIACADKNTGVLHLHNRGKCRRSQTRVTWSQKGPQGAQGAQGPAGASGAPAISVWANVTNTGSLFAGQGLSVQRVSAGTYQVTITAASCAHGSNAPVITVSDSNPPGGQPAGSFPVAWYGGTGLNQQFMVFTGVVAAGSFTLTDHPFTVMDSCM